jgi:hypothetical protein
MEKTAYTCMYLQNEISLERRGLEGKLREQNLKMMKFPLRINPLFLRKLKVYKNFFCPLSAIPALSIYALVLLSVMLALRGPNIYSIKFMDVRECEVAEK